MSRRTGSCETPSRSSRSEPLELKGKAGARARLPRCSPCGEEGRATAAPTAGLWSDASASWRASPASSSRRSRRAGAGSSPSSRQAGRRQVAPRSRSSSTNIEDSDADCCAAGVCRTDAASRSGRWSRSSAQAAGISEDDPPDVARGKLAAVSRRRRRCAASASPRPIGLSEQQFPVEELFWGTRKLFETLAAERPLVVVFEDIHWGEADVPRPGRAGRRDAAGPGHPRLRGPPGARTSSGRCGGRRPLGRASRSSRSRTRRARTWSRTSSADR